MRLIDADPFGVIFLQGKSEEFIEGVNFILDKIYEAPTVIIPVAELDTTEDSGEWKTESAIDYLTEIGWLPEHDRILTEQPQWIPCSERLPEDTRPVIVTWKNTDPLSYYQYIVGKHFTGTACYKNGKWYWYSSTTEDMLAEYGRYDSEEFDEAIECIAWMPLPEPYKEEGDRNEM